MAQDVAVNKKGSDRPSGIFFKEALPAQAKFYIVVAFVVGQVFSQLEKPMPLQSAQLMGLTGLLVEMAFCGLLYFFLNSSAVALAMALVTQQQFSELWTRNFLWALPANSVHAFTAGSVFLLFRPITFSVVIAILPLLGVLYYARRIRFYRVEQIGHI